MPPNTDTKGGVRPFAAPWTNGSDAQEAGFAKPRAITEADIQIDIEVGCFGVHCGRRSPLSLSLVPHLLPEPIPLLAR